MRIARLAIPASFLLGLVALAPLPLAGCDGKASDGQAAKVTPEFQKKTSDMLIQMSKDAQAKGKASAKRR
jgi:hypothetical protein